MERISRVTTWMHSDISSVLMAHGSEYVSSGHTPGVEEAKTAPTNPCLQEPLVLPLLPVLVLDAAQFSSLKDQAARETLQGPVVETTVEPFFSSNPSIQYDEISLNSWSLNSSSASGAGLGAENAVDDDTAKAIGAGLEAENAVDEDTDSVLSFAFPNICSPSCPDEPVVPQAPSSFVSKKLQERLCEMRAFFRIGSLRKLFVKRSVLSANNLKRQGSISKKTENISEMWKISEFSLASEPQKHRSDELLQLHSRNRSLRKKDSEKVAEVSSGVKKIQGQKQGSGGGRGLGDIVKFLRKRTYHPSCKCRATDVLQFQVKVQNVRQSSR